MIKYILEYKIHLVLKILNANNEYNRTFVPTFNIIAEVLAYG